MKLKTTKQLVKEAMDNVETITPNELKNLKKKKSRNCFDRLKRY